MEILIFLFGGGAVYLTAFTVLRHTWRKNKKKQDSEQETAEQARTRNFGHDFEIMDLIKEALEANKVQGYTWHFHTQMDTIEQVYRSRMTKLDDIKLHMSLVSQLDGFKIDVPPFSLSYYECDEDNERVCVGYRPDRVYPVSGKPVGSYLDRQQSNDSDLTMRLDKSFTHHYKVWMLALLQCSAGWAIDTEADAIREHRTPVTHVGLEGYVA